MTPGIWCGLGVYAATRSAWGAIAACVVVEAVLGVRWLLKGM